MTLLLTLLAFVAAAAGFAFFMFRRDQGAREPSWALLMAFAVGMVAVAVALGLELVLVQDVPAAAPGYQPPLHEVLSASLRIAVIEELAKCLPLIVLLYRRKFFNEHTDGVVYFALAGLGFGLPENILYTLQYGTETGVMRLLLTPLFHAAMTGLVGYGLTRVKLDGKSWWWAAGSVLLAVIIHTAYDVGMFSGRPLLVLVSLCLTIALSGSLFLLYYRARDLDQLQGLSAVGHNAFCRTCGQPNPKRYLFCTACGNRA